MSTENLGDVELAEPRMDILPRHVAISLGGIFDHAKKVKKSVRVVFREQIKKIKEIIKKQVELKIPITTFNLISSKVVHKEEKVMQLIDGMIDFFSELKSSSLVNKEKIKISVMGKWYYLPSRAIDSIKSLIEETKDYDGFFVNFCINYDGQEEIVDACKLIGRKIKAGKLDPEAVNHETVKDNIYSSYFLPPEMIIINGRKKKMERFMLWDSANAYIYFTGKSWPDFKPEDFKKMIFQYMKER